MPCRRAILLSSALWLLGSTAQAQGLPPMEPVIGLPGTVADLDARGEQWAVVFEDGSVRVHVPEGSDWFLRAPRERTESADDAVLRVEGLLDEIQSGEADSFDDIPVDDAEDGVDAIEQVDPGDEVEELLQGETALRAGVDRSGRRPVIRWGVDERIAVSRTDGVWESEDGGQRWHRLTRRPAVALADSGESWALLLPSGEIWLEGRRETVGLGNLLVDVTDLAASDGTLWAGSELGLWRRGESAGWELAGDDLESISALVADPGWEGGLWALTPSGVRRTDDGGVSWRGLEPGGPVVGRIRWGGPAPGGVLILSARDGFWQYREGAWNRDPRQAVTAVGTSAGMFAILHGGLYAPPGPEGPVDALPPWIPVGDLLHTALSRRELSEAMRAGRVAQTLMPEVVIEGRYSPDSSIDYLPFTTAQTGSEWGVLARLKWTPAGRSAAGETFDQTVEEIALRTGFDDLGIAGDRGVLGAMGGRVGRKAAGYRAKLVEEVTELYAARNALYFERAALPPGGLLEEVAWELRRAEIEARLDALTDGAVSSWSPDGDLE